jgi:hypothetical protein
VLYVKVLSIETTEIGKELNMTRMPFTPYQAIFATLVGLALATSNGVYAQVGTINSVIVHSREFNDVPGSTLTVTANYPSAISFSDQGVSAPSGFANRDVWRFSGDGGTSAYQFQNNDFFQVSMQLTLTATPLSPRKEAGFLLDTAGGQGQFIVNSDGHEIVAFGGPLPFYSFAPATYNSGDAITLGLTYFLDGNGKRAVIYSANGVQSPVLEFGNLEQGIINGSTVGGYFQIVNDGTNPLNSGVATFANISLKAVPEPSSFTLLSLGLLSAGLVLRRLRGQF